MQQQFFEQPLRQERQQDTARAAFAAPKRQSFLNTVLYLLAAFPLGVFYFVLLLTAFSFGFGMLAIWVGLPILYVTLLIWLRLASFERAHTMRLLNIYIEPMSDQRMHERGLWQSFKAHMTNPATWKSLAYLLAKYPFGIFSFTLTVSLLATSIALILSPLIYLVGTLLAATRSIPAGTWINFGPYGILIDGQFRFSSLLVLAVATVTGIALLYISRIILNFVAHLWGEFAKLMLSRHIAPQPMEAREFVGRPMD